jgi:DNA excision repair protein ERCC-5
MDEQKTLEKEKEVIAYDVEVMNKEDKTQKEININEINEQLNIETEYLLKEKQKETKLSNNVDSYLVEDAKYLCQLFGIPYIIAPGEAEAQCAYLDLTNQTNGSITEDSDIWLFGANNVYRSFFKQNTFIESYSSQLIKTQLGIDRDTLICIAMLVGSDYTLGIENVGIVKAMEILQEFDGESIEKLWNFK